MANSLFALIDDIATLLDDVAVLTKVAAKKTSGVLGDDLALNASQVAGLKADRELPVVWAVAKGSLRNKCILVPAAMAISLWAPWLVLPLLMLGGLFLCFEGVEKLVHKWLHSAQERQAHEAELMQALADPTVDLQKVEKDKIKGAVRTDLILSAEIIVITLGTVAGKSLLTQFTVLSGIALAMTVGVYGLVAGIVKLDDAGLYLTQCRRAWQQHVGRALLIATPYFMKALSVLGTAAVFLVGGGILSHSLPFLHHGLEQLMTTVPPALQLPTALLLDALTGIVAGALVVLLVAGVQRLWRKHS